MRKYVFGPKYRLKRQILNFLFSNKTSCVSFIQIVVKSNYLEYAMAYEDPNFVLFLNIFNF